MLTKLKTKKYIYEKRFKFYKDSWKENNLKAIEGEIKTLSKKNNYGKIIDILRKTQKNSYRNIQEIYQELLKIKGRSGKKMGYSQKIYSI